MTRTDIEREIIMATLMTPAKSIVLGEDELYPDEVDAPLVERVDLVVPDLEFMLKQEEHNYLLPLAEHRDGKLVAVGNNGYLEAHQRVDPNYWIYFHLTKPLDGTEPTPVAEVERIFGTSGPMTNSTSQAGTGKTFLFLEDRKILQRGRADIDVIRASEVFTEPPAYQIFANEGAIKVYHPGARSIPEMRALLAQELPSFYAEIEKQFGPLRSINGERVDH